MTPPPRHRRFLAPLVFAAGFALFPLQIVGLDFAHLPGDLVDNRLNNYVLEHGFRYVTRADREFWQAAFCFPAGHTVAASDAHIGNLPVYAAVRFAGAGPERAFQLWWLLTFPLNFAAAVWAGRRLGLTEIGTAVAAAGFTFGLPLVAEITHAQVFPRYFVPVAVALLWNGMTTPGWRPLAGVAACVLLQAYCTLYVAYFLVLLLAAVAVARVLVDRRSIAWNQLLRPGRREWLARIAVILAAAACLVPLARPYLIAHRGRPPEATTALLLLPKPADWVRPPPSALVWGGAPTPAANTADEPPPLDLFPGGFAAIGLAFGVFTLVRGGDKRAAGLALAALLLGLFVLRIGDTSAYVLAAKLPMAGGMRATFRVGLVLLFPLGVVAGFAADRVFSRRKTWVFVAVGVPLLAADLALVPRPHHPTWFHRYAIADAIQRRESLAAELAAGPRPVLFYVFPDTSGGHFTELVTHLDAMWAGQQAGVPTANGWTGQLPPGWYSFTHYLGLLFWLKTNDLLAADAAEKVATFGTPTGFDADPQEQRFRAAFRPRAWPPRATDGR